MEKTNTDESSSGGSEGFEKGSTIGIAIPWLGTQNWVEASDMFTEQLEKEGFKLDIQQADQDVETQKKQIEAMVDNGDKVIVIGSVDGTQLGDSLEKDKKAGVYIIGYDRMIEKTACVDGVVQFGSVKTGELQAQALLEGLEKEKGKGPYNIEIFAGGPADPNALNFYKGAMAILQPKIDDGTLNIVSGVTEFEEVATKDWDNNVADKRMKEIMSQNYSDKKIHGVLAPNDGIARTVINVCVDSGQEIVSKTVEIIKSLQAGSGMPSTSVTTNNGVVDVAVYELPPVAVTKENAKEAFMNDAERLALLK